MQTSEELLDEIKNHAVKEWGDRWLIEITRSGNEAYESDGDSLRAYKNRRTQVGQIFKRKTLTLSWFIRLAASVNLEICFRKKT